MLHKFIFSLALIMAWASVSCADVSLPRIFQDKMVFQRGEPIAVWGTASPGEKVTASLGDDVSSVVAGDDGSWELELPARPAAGATMPYRLLTPNGLEEGKVYPLVLCFHGAAGRGTDNMTRGTLAYKVLTSAHVQKKHPAFILAPQCPKGKKWVDHRWQDGAYDSAKVAISQAMTLALSILDETIKHHPVDPGRVYVTGRSMGGFASWDAIARRPEFFAAAVPVAGGGDPGMAARWKGLPIWAVASAGDKSCPVAGTRDVVEALRKEKGNVRYTEHPTKSHGKICQAWEDIPELAQWLFSNKKKGSPESQSR